MNFCKTCGREIEDGKKICMFCGCVKDDTDIENIEHSNNEIVETSHESHIALALSILGIFANFILTPIVGLALETIALVMVKHIRSNTDGIDTCAEITSAISTVSIVITVFVLAVILLIAAIVIIGYMLVAGSLATMLMGVYM